MTETKVEKMYNSNGCSCICEMSNIAPQPIK